MNYADRCLYPICNAVDFVNRCNDLKLPRANSPWTLSVSPKNQKIKLAYCQRMIRLLTGYATALIMEWKEGPPPENTFSPELLLWHRRMKWINENKL